MKGITEWWRHHEGDVEVCGGRMRGAGVVQSGGARWAVAGGSSSLWGTGVVVGATGKGWTVTALVTLLSNIQNLLAHANIAVAP